MRRARGSILVSASGLFEIHRCLPQKSYCANIVPSGKFSQKDSSGVHDAALLLSVRMLAIHLIASIYFSQVIFK